MSTATPSQRTVLVLGGSGFLGGFMVAALSRAGWQVIQGVRNPMPGPHQRAIDFNNALSPEDWTSVLDGVDVVVNSVGILRETTSQTFERIHEQAPFALAQACAARHIRMVQISALGKHEAGEFIASKHRFDRALSGLPVEAVIFRPSIVYSPAGSYGGTSLLRALAAFPFRHLLPGHGQWKLQPVSAEDLAELVVRAATFGESGIYEVGQQNQVSLSSYQAAWRRWLRIPGAAAFHVPEPLVNAQVTAGQALGRGPISEPIWNMLRQGNVATAWAWERLKSTFGFAPRDLEEVLSSHPSQTQDRWSAQLYFLAPWLKFSVVALWLLSAIVGWLTPAIQIQALAGDSLLSYLWPVELARATATLDAVLAVWLLFSRTPRRPVLLMLASVAAYTIAFGLGLPGQWLDPLGGLAKNLVLLPALAVLWVLVDRR